MLKIMSMRTFRWSIRTFRIRTIRMSELPAIINQRLQIDVSQGISRIFRISKTCIWINKIVWCTLIHHRNWCMQKISIKKFITGQFQIKTWMDFSFLDISQNIRRRVLTSLKIHKTIKEPIIKSHNSSQEKLGMYSIVTNLSIFQTKKLNNIQVRWKYLKFKIFPLKETKRLKNLNAKLVYLRKNLALAVQVTYQM